MKCTKTILSVLFDRTGKLSTLEYLSTSTVLRSDDSTSSTMTERSSRAKPNNAIHDLWKHSKHRDRLTPKHSVFHRQLFNNVRQVFQIKLCVPKHLRHKILCRILKSQLSGHLGINKLITEFWKQYYFYCFDQIHSELRRKLLDVSSNKKRSN